MNRLLGAPTLSLSWRRRRLNAISTNPRNALESRWRAQEAAEAADALAACPVECVAAVRDLAHLESLCELAGDTVVLVYCETEASGLCKYVRPAVAALCRDTTAVVLSHSLRDAYDEATDLAQLYRVKQAPSFLLFVQGALVERWVGGSSARVREALLKWGQRTRET